MAPAACNLDIAATGFLTSYVYSTDYNRANAQEITVTQGAQSRYFETDFLARTTLAVEPESNTTTYSYAYSATSGLGLTVTRVRPTANQGNASATTTTVTQYDSVGRVVSVTYTDGTPSKNFTYDLSNPSWTESNSQTNLVGRLSSHTRATGAGNAGSIYGYDAMGRVTLQYSCLPSGCGTAAYDRKVAYTYNTAGMLTSEGDGAGDTYTYSRSVAGEITGMTDSFSDATDPANVIVPGSVQNGPFGPTSYGLGNGLTAVNTYDSLGRNSGGFVCAGSSQPSCTGGTSQIYGYANQSLGTHVTQSCDTVLGVCNSFGYDEFNRLTARTVTSGTVQNFTYTYDRYGNRWAQNAPQGGPTLSITFNPANNIISSSGFVNDAVGNVVNDTFHGYSFDADGNLISVDSGQTAKYYYDSLNQRVQIAPTRGTYEFVWDIFGRRVSNWAASNHSFVESNAYTDSDPVAVRSGGQTEFEHQNWLGTERVRTTYNGAVAISIASLPWADQHTPSGDNGDQHDFAQMDRDLEDGTEHAQYRQFSTNLGRWLSPDHYLGSYDLSNPQSFNRFAYALNNPVNVVDPLGLDPVDCDSDDTVCVNAGDPSDPGDPGYPYPGGCCTGGNGNPGGGGMGGQPANPGMPFVFSVSAYAIWLRNFQLQAALLESVPFQPSAPSNDPQTGVPANPCASAGGAPNPSAYAAAGTIAKVSELLSPGGLLVNAAYLSSFRRGGALDAQPLGASRAYGNYVFGAYLSASGIPLSVGLGGANLYAAVSNAQYPGFTMDPNYPAVPQANVANIINGYNAQQNGTLCHK